MLPDDRNKLNRLEELKSKLFSKSYKNVIEHRDVYVRSPRQDVSDSWQTEKETEDSNRENFFMKTSVFKKFFVFSVVFFVLALMYAAYVFFAGGNTVSNDNIDLSILGNNFTAGGEELSLIVGITNRNSTPLELVDLLMEYPKGSSGDLSSDTETFRESIGTVPAGAVLNENLKVVLFGEQGSVRPVKISLEYRVAGSNAIFVKEKMYEVSINSTPLNLSVDAPSTVSPNQSVTFTVKAMLNTANPARNMLLRLDYPVGFVFSSAIPAPAFGNNIWSLGDLAPGVERSISISGKMVGVFDGEQKTFNISSGSGSIADKSTIETVFNSFKQTIAIQKPFIQADLYLSGVSQMEYATDAKSSINAEVRYANNLDTVINDLEIKVKISGNAVNYRTIKAQQGFYDSADNVITWSGDSQGNLAKINPGDSSSVQFSLSPLSLFSASGGLLSNPSINIEVDVSGKKPIEGNAVSEVDSSSSAVIRIISDVGFSEKALYYSGPFTNTGPIPPKVGQATTYTITWALSNTANSISGAEVHSSLPAWVNFAGPVSPSDENLTYNPSTREIVWMVGRVQKGAGITGASRTVSFQVIFTPSLSQLGTSPILINNAFLTGHDDFAKVDVRVSKNGMSARLEGDTSVSGGEGLVVE